MELRARTDDDIDACELLAREVHHVDGYPPRFADDLRRFVSVPGALGAWVAAIGLYERSGWVRAGRVDVAFRDAEPLAEYVYIGPHPGTSAAMTS